MGNYISSVQEEPKIFEADKIKEEYKEGYDRLREHYQNKHNYDLFERYFEYSQDVRDMTMNMSKLLATVFPEYQAEKPFDLSDPEQYSFVEDPIKWLENHS